MTVYRAFLFILTALFVIPITVAQDDALPVVPVQPGETISGDFSEPVTYSIDLELAQTVVTTLAAPSNSMARVTLGLNRYPDGTSDQYEFNAPADDTYLFEVMPGDDVTEGAYSFVVESVDQVETTIGETVTIPAGAQSPYYLIFPAELGDYLRVSADDDGVGIRVEDAGGMPTVYNGNGGLNQFFYFSNSVDLAPFSTEPHRAVIVPPNEAERFMDDVTVTIERLESFTDTIAIGESITMTSVVATTFFLDLEAGQAVQINLTNDFRGWIQVITPERGVIYRNGHNASGGERAEFRYVAVEPIQLALRISGSNMFPADGLFTLSVEEFPVRTLSTQPTTLENGTSDGFIAVDLVAGQSYRLALQADSEIHLTLINANSKSIAEIPRVTMPGLLETARIWTADATGTAYIQVDYGPEDAPVSLMIEPIE